ncbi:MAG: SDR family NAD(P)-dependent oxidoreductase [Myxococcota bacterium]
MIQSKTLLVTGANSGLGLEAARQLLLRNGTRVVLTARTSAKAGAAVETLRRATGASPDRMDVVLVDFTDPASVDAAIEALARFRLDGVVLNAGGVARMDDGGRLAHTPQGLTTMYAMNVGGHAQLVEGLLDRGVFADGASIVFAGSEASRGIPAMGATAPTLPELPGSLDDVIAAVARGEHATGKVDALTEYGLVKLIGTAWIRDLTERHGDSLRAYTVSPGASAGTAGPDGMPFPMNLVMKYLMFPAFQLLGRAHGVRTGAARYLAGLDGEGLDNGAFYASPYPHMSGRLVRQEATHQPLLDDTAFTAAVGRTVRTLNRGAAVPS